MSHFVVAVITKDVADLESVLQPYHEFECTGTNDRYVQDVDITDEIKGVIGEEITYGDDKGKLRDLNSALAYEGIEDVVSDESELDKEGKHKYRYAIVKDGELIKAVRRTNENKKWDWYQVGGRWRDLLMTKTGDKVDQAKKSEIDFAMIRSNAENEAAAEYDAAVKVIDGRPIPHWDHFREVLFPGKIEEARKAFHDDPCTVAWRAAYPDNFFGPDPENYDMTREAFIEAAGDNSFGAFAVVNDSELSLS